MVRNLSSVTVHHTRFIVPKWAESKMYNCQIPRGGKRITLDCVNPREHFHFLLTHCHKWQETWLVWGWEYGFRWAASIRVLLIWPPLLAANYSHLWPTLLHDCPGPPRASSASLHTFSKETQKSQSARLALLSTALTLRFVVWNANSFHFLEMWHFPFYFKK